MKLFYAIVLVLMVLVSACAQQTESVQTQPTPQEKEPAKETAEPAEAKEGEVMEEKIPAAPSGDVRILGRTGFEPTELTVSAGASVTWLNDDEKILTLTIFKDGKFFVNSDQIKPGEIWEQEFAEAGEYEYWSVAYGPTGAKIVVE